MSFDFTPDSFNVYNVLLYKVRKNKPGQIDISKADAMDIFYDLQKLLIYTEPQSDGEIRSRIFDLAEEYDLSYYDASYLELARRYNLPLKTYDKQLKTALADRPQ